MTRLAIIILLLAASCGRSDADKAAAASPELPVTRIPGFYSAAETYFSPDGKSLILNGRRTEDETDYHVYTIRIDGQHVQQVNDTGADACSYYFPSGDRLIWTSTRDNLHLPAGNYSDPASYPAGAELYTSDLTGGNRVRLTHNELYEAEVSLSPDGQWILFGRSIEGRMDLWRMRPDGTGEVRITDTPDLQEGGAFYMPDSRTIIYRAWNIADQAGRSLPMTIYTINHDGTDRRQITTEPGTNWAPHPSPDGRHFVFVKMLPPHNFEVFLMNIETGKQAQLTYNDSFDGFPAFSPDGHTIAFSSGRDAEEGARTLNIYLMDIGPMLEE